MQLKINYTRALVITTAVVSLQWCPSNPYILLLLLLLYYKRYDLHDDMSKRAA